MTLNTIFEAVGKYSQNKEIGKANVKMPANTLKPIGTRCFNDFIGDFIIFEVEYNIFSNSPHNIAAVPPLTPGIIAPTPMKKPFKKVKKRLLIFVKL